MKLTTKVSLLAFLVLLLGITYAQNARPAAQTAPQVIQSYNQAPTGRYQIVINPGVRADTFLLDTQTGKVWQRVTFTDLEKNPDA